MERREERSDLQREWKRPWLFAGRERGNLSRGRECSKSYRNERNAGLSFKPFVF